MDQSTVYITGCQAIVYIRNSSTIVCLRWFEQVRTCETEASKQARDAYVYKGATMLRNTWRLPKMEDLCEQTVEDYYIEDTLLEGKQPEVFWARYARGGTEGRE